MDIAWLALVGVMLLVAGLSALGYDTVRHKNNNQPFPYPDAPTNLLSETAIQKKPRLPKFLGQPPAHASGPRCVARI